MRGAAGGGGAAGGSVGVVAEDGGGGEAGVDEVGGFAADSEEGFEGVVLELEGVELVELAGEVGDEVEIGVVGDGEEVGRGEVELGDGVGEGEAGAEEGVEEGGGLGRGGDHWIQYTVFVWFVKGGTANSREP